MSSNTPYYKNLNFDNWGQPRFRKGFDKSVEADRVTCNNVLTKGLIVSTALEILLKSSYSSPDAILIEANAIDGGIHLISGTGGINIDSTGTLDIDVADFELQAGTILLDATDAGPDSMILRASNAAGEIAIVSGTGGIDIDTTGLFDVLAADINQQGGTITLTGTDAGPNSILIQATNAAGEIAVTSGTGGIDIDTTGLFDVLAADINLVADTVNIEATDAGPNSIIINASNAAGELFLVSGTGGLDINSTGLMDIDVADYDLLAGTVLIQGSDAIANAVQISANNGGIDIQSGTGGLDFDTSGQISLTSTQAGPDSILIEATNVTGEITVNTGTGGFDLTSVGGAIVISTSNVSNNALQLTASNAAGGIDVNCGSGGFDVASVGGLVRLITDDQVLIQSTGNAANAVNIVSSGGIEYSVDDDHHFIGNGAAQGIHIRMTQGGTTTAQVIAGAIIDLTFSGNDFIGILSYTAIIGAYTLQVDFASAFGTEPIVHATIDGAANTFNVANITKTSFQIIANSPAAIPTSITYIAVDVA